MPEQQCKELHAHTHTPFYQPVSNAYVYSVPDCRVCQQR